MKLDFHYEYSMKDCEGTCMFRRKKEEISVELQRDEEVVFVYDENSDVANQIKMIG